MLDTLPSPFTANTSIMLISICCPGSPAIRVNGNAISLPASRAEAIAAEAAAARLQEGELLNGRQSRSALTAREDNESQDSGGERSTDDPDDSAALFFEFFEVAPPTLPEKDIPIR